MSGKKTGHKTGHKTGRKTGNKTGPLLVIAAGGTGGHLFPAQALAEEMLRRGWRVVLSTDERGATYTGAFPEAVEIQVAPSATFARGGPMAKLGVPFQILAGVIRVRRAFRADPPAAVVGFGGYPAIPAMAAALSLGLPRMIHEQNGVLGRVNQLFAKRVGRVACGTWPTELPEGVEAVHTGNPVRAAIQKKAGAPYIPPGDHPMELLVTGGSQGARILSDVVPQAVLGLPEGIRSLLRVSHQARPEDIERVSDAYAGAGMRADVRSFFTDMPVRIGNAQLVVARAGASTVADISVIGRPSILIPLASAIRDEQTANARGLVEADAAVMVPESGLDAAALSAHIALILGDPAMAEAMAAAALSCAKPDAASDLADQVEELGAARPGRDGGRDGVAKGAESGAQNGAQNGPGLTMQGQEQA